MKTRPVVYPFLIAIYPIVSLYAQNAREVPPGELALPLALALACASVFWAILALVLRNPHWAGIFTLLAAVFCGMAPNSADFASQAYYFVTGFWVPQVRKFSPMPIVAVQAAFFLAIAFVARWKLKEPRRVTPVLNLFALILIAMPTMQAVDARVRASRGPRPILPLLATLEKPDRRPDIYYIILDAFARADVLKDQFDYDLEPFLKRLEEKGFYVARRSTTNYCQTPLSLTSSLNGSHLHAGVQTDQTSAYPDAGLFRDNAVIRALRPIGYQFVTFSSGFDFTEHPRSDLYLSPYRTVSGFHRMLLESSLLSWLLPNPMEFDSYTMTRDRTLFLFDKLPELAKIEGPTFTFAHVLSPHPPFVFGEDGEDISPHHVRYFLNDGDVYRRYYGDESSYIKGYRQNAAFLVKKAEQAIDRILAASPEPPIIILQSDHGSGLNLDMASDERTDHHERMSILNAYYLPGGRREGLHDRITPVNSFRMVFNNYFGTKLDFLPDENYYSTWSTPFEFFRVTDRVSSKASTAASTTAKPAGGPSAVE